MKGICIILAVLACASALTTVDKEWESFKTTFGKQYSEKEEVHRHEIFSKNKKMIEEHNKNFAAGKVTFSMAVNKFADLTEEEMKTYRGGKRTAEELKRGTTVYTPKVGASYPDTVDWRNQGYVTGVKDQGQCGSCWAFSTTGSLEGQHFRYTGALISLSEQNLVDCVPGNSCNGGWMDTAFAWIRDNGGIDTEASYPYEAANGACRYNAANIGATCTGFIDIASGNEDALLGATADNGPISVAIDASKSTFSYYGGGVYYDGSCSSTTLDHGVLVVGYGTQDGSAYWLVKNSWGAGWGESGYIKMARNAGNNCGIATAASFPTV